MKKEVIAYDEHTFYYPPMPPVQPSIAQHHNLTSIEETIFQILGKKSVMNHLAKCSKKKTTLFFWKKEPALHLN